MPVFHVEMRWRCSACQQEVLGRYKFCQSCGKPKNDEPFYDAEVGTSPAYAVTDPELVALATAGADWTCRYCQSRQSNLKTRCESCGSSKFDAFSAARQPGAPLPVESPPFDRRAYAREQVREGLTKIARSLGTIALFVAFAFLGPKAIELLFSLEWGSTPTRLEPPVTFRQHVVKDVQAHVVSRAWMHKVVVERYMLVDGYGFEEDRPKDAVSFKVVGQRPHHHDSVPRGYRQESYTERVRCGEDCTTSSVSCKSNDNGFKTCTGGDRVCKTRYCTETRYRNVRQHENVSVMAPWFAWRVGKWVPQREVVKRGTDEAPSWPSKKEIALGKDIPKGEKVREQRSGRYEILFEDEHGIRHFHATSSFEQFAALPLGKAERLRLVDGHMEILWPSEASMSAPEPLISAPPSAAATPPG